jgi:hypothetical protein
VSRAARDATLQFVGASLDITVRKRNTEVTSV